MYADESRAQKARNYILLRLGLNSSWFVWLPFFLLS